MTITRNILNASLQAAAFLAVDVLLIWAGCNLFVALLLAGMAAGAVANVMTGIE